MRLLLFIIQMILRYYNLDRLTMIKFILILGCVILASSLKCQKPQRVGWFTFDALSARDHITQVFEEINPSMTKADPYTTTLNGTQYTITDFVGHAYYNDIFQKDVYVNDTVVNVTGGSLAITVRFNYSHNGTSGYAQGHATADTFWFTKKIERPGGFITWEPVFINNITIKDNIVISNSDPKLTDTAKSAYQNIINNHAQEQNRLKDNLLMDLNRFYNAQLTKSLHNEDLVSINNITYKYKGETVNYTNAVLDVKLNNIGFKGLQYSFFFELENYTTECNDLPTAYNQSYGGVQQIFGFSWVKSTANYFAQKGLFNAKLDGRWDNEMFQFFLGDLGNVIPQAQKYQPDTAITGTCNIRKDQEFIVAYGSNNSIRAQIPYTLKLYVNQTTLLQTVNFTAVFEQRWSLSSKAISTKIVYSGIANVKFETAGAFEVTNTALASQYIKKMVESLEQKASIGDGFEVVRRNKGGIVITQNYIIMYDPSEV